MHRAAVVVVVVAAVYRGDLSEKLGHRLRNIIPTTDLEVGVFTIPSYSSAAQSSLPEALLKTGPFLLFRS